MNTSAEHTQPAHLEKRIRRCMTKDQHRLRRVLRQQSRLSKQSKLDKITARATDYTALIELIDASEKLRSQREQNIPNPTYDDALPVADKRNDIAKTIIANQVVILCGETGSGKTTQVPKICLDIGRGVAGMIGHTQPRRIAARSVAARIASELHTEIAKSVGYKIRFHDRTSPQCYIKMMTDGIMLAETQSDRYLNTYDTIIIDEAHERSLNIDFLLGYIKRILPKRPDLKVIIMSATIDAQRFSEHFNNAPVIEVSGRTYPVEVRYRPVLTDSGLSVAQLAQTSHKGKRERNMQDAILDAVDELAETGNGDILVFLSGERDIRETAESLRKHHPIGTEILPLFARLSASEQNRVFQSHPGRRIILATNVAETSLTVPGVRYVIDTGFARISRFSPQTRVQRLPIEAISQASANQRKGRCGRVREGVCIRLYAEDDYNTRSEYTDPEILRSNLAGVILQMKSLHLGDLDRFPFLDPPEPKQIRDGYLALRELGAIDLEQCLTDLGRTLARLPVDPRIGRMLIAADEEECLEEMLIIASMLSIRDPRERPMDFADAADTAHAEYQHETSDFLGHITLWNEYHEQVRHLSGSKLRKWCKAQFLSFQRMREWHDIYKQLRTQMTSLGYHPNKNEAEDDAIHRAILTGLLSQIGMKTESYEYIGTRGIKFRVFPGSGLFKKTPKWIMAAELVRTTQLFARSAAKINVDWVEKAAAHLIKRNYSEPFWDDETAHVRAFEKITLYGLNIVPSRRVHYGPIDPVESRKLFIRHAFVLGEYSQSGSYYQHNAHLLKKVDGLEARARRRDLAADPDRIFQFYDKKLPQDVYSGPSFEKWRKKEEQIQPRTLYMNMSDVLSGDANHITKEAYPNYLNINANQYPLTYVFQPGAANDGLTISIPITAVSSLDTKKLDWLIPGWRAEKAAAVIRSLPKTYRTALQPVNELVSAVASYDCNSSHDKSMCEVIAEIALDIRGIIIPQNEFHCDTLADHLHIRYRVLDQHQKVLATGRDLFQLRSKLKRRIEKALSQVSRSAFQNQNLTAWDFGELPRTTQITESGITIDAYPTLIDRTHSVSLQLVQSRALAASYMRAGVRRLFILIRDRMIRDQSKNLRGFSSMAVQFSPLGSTEELRSGIIEIAAGISLFKDDIDPDSIRSEAAFEHIANDAESRMYTNAGHVCSLVSHILTAYHEVESLLSNESLPKSWDAAIADMDDQLGLLLCERFLTMTPYLWLEQMPRYLCGISSRLRKLRGGGVDRDRQMHAQFTPWWTGLHQQLSRYQRDHLDPHAGLEQYRWMLEEMRVSLFAQELGTAAPVSFKRLEALWGQIR